MTGRSPLVLAWIITGLWAVAYTRKIIDPSFPVPAEITPVMLAAAAYIFGSNVRESLKRKVDDRDRDRDKS